MGDLSEERATSQARASVWRDGKRRVTVAQPTRIIVGRQLVTKRTDEVIDDPELIKILEEHGVELVDLDVLGRRVLSGDQQQAQEAVRTERITVLANALDIEPTTLIEAIERGGYEPIRAVNDALEQRYTRELRAELDAKNARIAELEEAAATAASAAAEAVSSADVPAPDAAEQAEVVDNGVVPPDVQATAESASGPSLDDVAGEAAGE